MAKEAKAPDVISVIGMGKLGSPMAAAVATRGIRVIGADVDAVKVNCLREGKPPVSETGLADSIRRAGASLTATTDIREAVVQSQVTFIIVPTPSEPQGGFSLRHVLPACKAIGAALKEKKDYHIVVVTSTVMPGSTGGTIRECLEAESGKHTGSDFGLCYSPEFIALGSVIRDFLNPDFILVGESDSRAGDVLEAFYHTVCENQPHIARMNYVNAELAKIAVNSYITTKITFANTLGHICEGLPGADIDTVTTAIGHDSRIGVKYLRGAVGYGGPCFPRDNIALSKLARDVGVDPLLAEATDCANRAEAERLAALVTESLQSDMRVGILGLAYKPDTDVIEESQGINLAQILLARDVHVVVYDPEAMQSAQVVLGDRPVYAGSAKDCLALSDVAVIVTPWKEFAEMGADVVAGRTKPLVLIDGWRVVSSGLQKAVTQYVPVGVSRSR